MVTYNSDLNWSSGALPGVVTHGGGTNGRKWNSSGNLVAGSAGRITFDPAALTCLGAWLEGARTNMLFPSQDLSSANFYQDNSTVTVNNVTSPDGTADADTLVGALVSPSEVCFGWTGTMPVLGHHTAQSCFYKPAAVNPTNFAGFMNHGFNTGSPPVVDGISNILNIATGALGSQNLGTGSGTILNQGAIDVGNSGWRFAYMGGFFGGTFSFNTLQFQISGTATPSSGYDQFGQATFTGQFSLAAWQWQLEDNADFPSSPIVTTTVAVTRSADTATTTDATYIAQGAFLVEGQTALGLPAAGTTQIIAQWDDTTTGNLYRVERDSAGNIHVKVITLSVTVADLVSVATVSNNTAFKIAFRVALNDFAMSLNGATVVTDTLGVVPTITTGRFGTDTAGANYWFGTLARVRGATTMSNAELVVESGGAPAALPFYGVALDMPVRPQRIPSMAAISLLGIELPRRITNRPPGTTMLDPPIRPVSGAIARSMMMDIETANILYIAQLPKPFGRISMERAAPRPSPWPALNATIQGLPPYYFPVVTVQPFFGSMLDMPPAPRASQARWAQASLQWPRLLVTPRPVGGLMMDGVVIRASSVARQAQMVNTIVRSTAPVVTSITRMWISS